MPTKTNGKTMTDHDRIRRLKHQLMDKAERMMALSEQLSDDGQPLNNQQQQLIRETGMDYIHDRLDEIRFFVFTNKMTDAQTALDSIKREVACLSFE